jgi:ArsR family transcriptional regulator, lead/cadmium/zinc/bismuth-responsive transcriptional repressor
MHLVPAERAGHRAIDGHRACEAIAALGAPGAVASWAQRFSLLADPGRLSLVVCIRAAGPISVTDLALATGMHDTAVSQALRLLRAAGVVAAQRDGRIIRYSLADEAVGALLAEVFPPMAAPAGADAARG